MYHNKALIITPTGTDPFFDPQYDKDSHWRFVSEDRTYETCVVTFNDHVPQPGSYDILLHHKGLKWNMLNDICEKIRWESYDYIGYWDDDYCTDIKSVNMALHMARKGDFAYFQQALTSWTVYPCLEWSPALSCTKTNFIELGVPFFRNDIFRKVLALLRDYRYKESDWGIDKILFHYLNLPAHVVHESTIKHMRRESSYSKEAGFREMDYLMKDWYPKYAANVLKRPYTYNDQQVVLEYAEKR